MIDALAEVREKLLTITPNVKFAETVTSLETENFPLITIEIWRAIPEKSTKTKRVYLQIIIYDKTLANVILLSQQIENLLKSAVWNNCVYVEQYRAIDTSQVFIKSKRMINGQMVLEMVLHD